MSKKRAAFKAPLESKCLNGGFGFFDQFSFAVFLTPFSLFRLPDTYTSSASTGKRLKRHLQAVTGLLAWATLVGSRKAVGK